MRSMSYLIVSLFIKYLLIGYIYEAIKPSSLLRLKKNLGKCSYSGETMAIFLKKHVQKITET